MKKEEKSLSKMDRAEASKPETSKPAPTVTECRAQCPKCASVSREKLNGTRTLPIQREVDGRRYTCVTLAYTRCKSCGQVYIVRTYK